jgi:hypothetical protein
MQDVASTRDRRWHSHPQNVFYRDLVIKAAPTINDKEGTTRRVAERIVDIIALDKGGVFVKDLPSGWVIMSRNEAIYKTQQALRNTKRKIEQGGWKKKGPSKKKKSFRPPPPPKQLITYQAQAGDSTSIHPYALLLISAICNASKQQPREALHVLDAPMSRCFEGGGEPRKERTMRLQVRHLVYSIMFSLSLMLVCDLYSFTLVSFLSFIVTPSICWSTCHGHFAN